MTTDDLKSLKAHLKTWAAETLMLIPQKLVLAVIEENAMCIAALKAVLAGGSAADWERAQELAKAAIAEVEGRTDG